MAHEANYEAACHPARVTVLGRRLRHFCLGHASLLQRVRSPFLRDEGWREAAFADLLLAAEICSRDWEEGIGLLDSERGREVFQRTLKWSHWQYRMHLAFRPAMAGMAAHLNRVTLAGHIAAAMAVPPLNRSGEGRALGTPSDLVIVSTLMGHYGLTEREAMNMPRAKAIWWHCAAHESKGNLQVQNESDISLHAAADAMRANLAEAEARLGVKLFPV